MGPRLRGDDDGRCGAESDTLAETCMSEPSFRRDWITKPIFGFARRALPSLSATEREAIEAGDLWRHGDLFRGQPNWPKLHALPPGKISARRTAVPRAAGHGPLRL